MGDEVQRQVPRSILGIDETVAENVIKTIDDTNFFYLGTSNCSRSELMMYAMAIGRFYNFAVPIKKALSGGFARTSYFNEQMKTMIKLLHLSKIGFDNPDGLRDVNEGYRIFEEYANGGFNILKNDVNQKIDTDEKALEIFTELDNKYKEFFNN